MNVQIPFKKGSNCDHSFRVNKEIFGKRLYTKQALHFSINCHSGDQIYFNESSKRIDNKCGNRPVALPKELIQLKLSFIYRTF